jgi:hypothetical protein
MPGRYAADGGDASFGSEASARAASAHLAKLVAGGLLAVEPEGRHRHFRLAKPQVARALETLAGITPRPVQGPPGSEVAEIAFARTCYDHLAGWLGVAVKDALVERKLLVPEGSEFRVTSAGEAWMARFGVDVDAAREVRRAFARACLDWSERRHHLAGALGQSLLDRLLERRWLVRRPGERTLDVTTHGRRELTRELGIRLAPESP